MLTKAQNRMLDELEAAGGERSYNGRARRQVEALRDAGLVTYEFMLVPHADGKYTQTFIVSLVVDDLSPDASPYA